MATASPEIAMAEAKPVGFRFGDLERDFLMESKVPPPKKVLDRELLTERMEAASESLWFGERKELALMLFVVKLLLIAGTGGTAEVGDSTRGSLEEEVMGFSFVVFTVNEDLLVRFERVEGCGAARVA
jgi:hypothetical protein